MNTRHLFATILVGLLHAGLPVVQDAAASEPDAVPMPAPASAVPNPTAEVPAPQAGPPTDTDAPIEGPQSSVTAVKTPAAAEGTVLQPAAAQPAPGDDEAVVCKQVEVFGSRVRRGKLCRTKKEWQMETQAAKDFSKAIQKGSATQPRDVGGT